jgi:hypothetical protein
MARPRSLADRFCHALFEETGGRPMVRYASITSIALRLAIDQDKAEAIAAELDARDLVRMAAATA